MTTHRIEYAYSYERSWHPRSGQGAREGRKDRMIGRETAEIPEVPASEAPVAVTLPRVDGGRVVLRHVQGRLMRPVRAPGSWEGITVQGFEEAAKGGRSWRDSPFLPHDSAAARLEPHQRWSRPVGSKGCETLLKAAMEPPTDARRWGDDADMAAQRRRCAARVADLRVVDGIVHEPCSEPRLFVGRAFDQRTAHSPGPMTVKVAWVMDGYDESHDPDLGATSNDAPDIAWHRGMAWKPDFWKQGGGSVLARATSFPLDRAEDAELFAQAWAARCEVGHARRDMAFGGDPSSVVTSDDATALVDLVRSSFGEGSEAWATLHLQSDDLVRRWVTLRRTALDLPEAPDADQARDLLQSAFALSDDMSAAAHQPRDVPIRVAALRWDVVESRRDLSASPWLVPGREDEALASFGPR